MRKSEQEIVLEADKDGNYTLPAKSAKKERSQYPKLFSLALTQRKNSDMKGNFVIGRSMVVPATLGLLVVGLGGYFINTLIRKKFLLSPKELKSG